MSRGKTWPTGVIMARDSRLNQQPEVTIESQVARMAQEAKIDKVNMLKY